MLCFVWSRYGIILCQMDYIFIDGVAVLSLGYAMTLSYPKDKLAKVFGKFFCAFLSVCMSINLLTLLHQNFQRDNSESWFPGRCALHRVS
jgi:uncharacterized membrane protein YkvI